jgi:hypothetical protein
MSVKTKFKLKTCTGGAVIIRIEPTTFDRQPISKSFFTPEGDGQDFEKFFKNLKDDDEITIEFENAREVLKEKLKELISRQIDELLSD